MKVICGKFEGYTGPIVSKSPVYYFDIKILPGGKFKLPISGTWNSLIFLYEGDLYYQEDLHVKSF